MSETKKDSHTAVIKKFQMNPDESPSASTGIEIRAASVPIAVLTKDIGKLTTQISAPSYLNSLKENEAPPFKRPEREARPRLVIGTLLSEQEAVQMVAAAESDPVCGLKKFLAQFLVEKKVIPNYGRLEREFLISLMTETIDYAAQRDFSAFKLACILTIYLSSHMYFKWYYWSAPAAIWYYFKELMIRHSIQDSPDGQQVFEPEDCYDILTHFHAMYISNLPLIHIITFGCHRLKISWPFKMK